MRSTIVTCFKQFLIHLELMSESTQQEVSPDWAGKEEHRQGSNSGYLSGKRAAQQA